MTGSQQAGERGFKESPRALWRAVDEGKGSVVNSVATALNTEASETSETLFRRAEVPGFSLPVAWGEEGRPRSSRPSSSRRSWLGWWWTSS